MLGGSVEVWMKNVLYGFIKGQNHFGVPRDVKNKFRPWWTNTDCSSFKSRHYLQACTTSGKKLMILYANQPMNIIEDQVLRKCPIELKDNCNGTRIFYNDQEIFPLISTWRFWSIWLKVPNAGQNYRSLSSLWYFGTNEMVSQSSTSPCLAPFV